MAKLSFYFDTRRADREGKFPLIISIYHNYKTMRLPLGIKLTKSEWGQIESEIQVLPRNKWSASTINVYAKKSMYDAALCRLQDEYDIDEISVSELRDLLENEGGEKTIRKVRKKPTKITFVGKYREYADAKATKGTRSLYAQTLRKILVFDQNAERLTFEDIDKQWLSEFDKSMQESVSPNIRNMHFRNIRAIFNEAINDDITNNYPFRKFRLPKLQETKHRSLTIEQLRAIQQCSCEPWMEEYRDMFLLSFYLIGINAVDLLYAKPTDVENGRLNYRRKKTHRVYTIKIEPEAQSILDKYKGEKWLLSPLDRYANHLDYLHHWNKALKKLGMTCRPGVKPTGTAICPGLSTYWARHSWATTASMLDVPMDIIGRALGHSWVNSLVTSTYILFDTRKIDEANRIVIDAVLGKDRP